MRLDFEPHQPIGALWRAACGPLGDGIGCAQQPSGSVQPFLCGRRCRRPRLAVRRVAAAASSKPADFDEFLMMVAEKFEKVDNKPVVVG